MRVPSYAVNHYLCPADVSFSDFARVVAEAGFHAVGVTERALDELGVGPMARVLDDLGLGVSSVNSAGFFLSDDPAQPARNAALLEAAGQLKADALNVLVGGGPESLCLEQAREQALAGLAAFAADARTARVPLVVEPMWLANVFGKSCVNSIVQLERAASSIPGLALNLDYYHSWADPDLGRVLRGESLPVGLLQICDVDWAEQPNQALRAPLGEGRLRVLDQLAAHRWQPGNYPVELELFAHLLPGRDHRQLIHQAGRLLEL